MMDTSRKELQTMHGMKFLAAWLLFGVPSSLIACAVGNLIGWNAVTVALLVVLIELSVVMSGVFCVAAKQADERIKCDSRSKQMA